MGDRTMGNRAHGVIALLVALALALVPQGAMAWGSFGHRTTAEIALANVSPHTRAEIAKLIAHARELGTPDCPIRNLEDAAVWPDCLRGESWRWGYSFSWHYQTEPVDTPYDVRANCSGGNCVSAQITRNQRILSDESLPPAVRLEALAFLVHFIGDIHQPLHSGDDDDKGGNDRRVDYGIVPALNLHSIWDTTLAERAITSAQPPLVRRYTPAERAALAGGTPADWGRESWALARSAVYPGAYGRDPVGGDPLPKEGALSQSAIEEAIPVAQRRIVQAGLRMADALDAAFAPGKL
ncbi:MAG: S1/P1 nuclease [Sphingomonadales bacterium]|nr:S1/P1 nuclease [Sphingomonadales bacterium]MBD3772145.1 S1/P1 nuclease [Paracoccaceae bacterium]